LVDKFKQQATNLCKPTNTTKAQRLLYAFCAALKAQATTGQVSLCNGCYLLCLFVFFASKIGAKCDFSSAFLHWILVRAMKGRKAGKETKIAEVRTFLLFAFNLFCVFSFFFR
jgi:hypothetical protein